MVCPQEFDGLTNCNFSLSLSLSLSLSSRLVSSLLADASREPTRVRTAQEWWDHWTASTTARTRCLVTVIEGQEHAFVTVVTLVLTAEYVVQLTFCCGRTWPRRRTRARRRSGVPTTAVVVVTATLPLVSASVKFGGLVRHARRRSALLTTIFA
jgi:hypothetical protein